MMSNAELEERVTRALRLVASNVEPLDVDHRSFATEVPRPDRRAHLTWLAVGVAALVLIVVVIAWAILAPQPVRPAGGQSGCEAVSDSTLVLVPVADEDGNSPGCTQGGSYAIPDPRYTDAATGLPVVRDRNGRRVGVMAPGFIPDGQNIPLPVGTTAPG